MGRTIYRLCGILAGNPIGEVTASLGKDLYIYSWCTDKTMNLKIEPYITEGNPDQSTKIIFITAQTESMRTGWKIDRLCDDSEIKDGQK